MVELCDTSPAEPFGPPLIKPDDLARMLGVTTKTLARWRKTGEGPPFVSVSRKLIRYRRSDVQAFLAGRVGASCTTARHRPARPAARPAPPPSERRLRLEIADPMIRNNYPRRYPWLIAPANPFDLSADDDVLLEAQDAMPLLAANTSAVSVPLGAAGPAVQMPGRDDLPYDPRDAGYAALTMEEWEEVNSHWTTGMALQE